MESSLVIQGWWFISHEGGIGGYYGLLDVVSLDPKRNPGKAQENLCMIYLVRFWRKVHTTLVKMGQHSLAKSPRRMGARKYSSLLKGPCSKILLETHLRHQHVDACIAQKCISPDTIEDWIRSPLKASKKWLDYLESNDLFIPSGWGQPCLEGG